MAVRLNEEFDGKVLHVEAEGKLTRADYEQFVPRVEELIRKHGKIRVLFRMKDFHGWTAGALWEDIKFDLKHFRDIERLALVGDKAWEKGMAVFCRPFTTASIRYFDVSEEEKAREWIQEALAVPTQ